jgi:hypothetical protein
MYVKNQLAFLNAVHPGSIGVIRSDQDLQIFRISSLYYQIIHYITAVAKQYTTNHPAMHHCQLGRALTFASEAKLKLNRKFRFASKRKKPDFT